MYLARLFITILLFAAATSGCSQVNTTSSQSAADSATLTWVAPTTKTDSSPLTDLAGYYIYYGSSEETLTQTITLVDAEATTYVVSGLTSGTWYFAVQAYDSAGNRSAFSNIASKTL